MRLGLASFLAVAVAAGTVQAQETPRRGGTLVYSVYTGELDTYDCHASVSGSVVYRVFPHYSTLVTIDQANYPQVKGDTAESWTVSSDGLTYSFRLRPGIKFHDGSPFSSADVKATFDRIRNPPAGVISARQSLYRDIAAIETPDERTVVFRLSKPNAAMLTFLASPWNCLYSARKLAEDPTFPAKNILGTGPFRFVAHVPGSEWKGERFEGYFREGRPYLDGYRVVNMAPPALINALSAGQIQTEFRGLSAAERDRVVASRGDKVRVMEAEQPGLTFVTFNTQKAPFNDVRVRRAMNLAIDRWGGAAPMEKLAIFNRVGGFQRIGTTFGRTRAEIEQLPGFGRDMAANRAEARRLLAEAGHPNLTAVFTNRQNLVPLGVFLIDQWRQIGVTVTQDLPENARFFAARQSGNFDLIIDAAQDYVDEPSLQFSYFLSHDINPVNISRAIDRTVDNLYERQARLTDVAERRKVVLDLEQHLMEQAYSIPFYWVQRIIVMASEVRGFHMQPSGVVGQDLADLWLAQ